MPWRLWIFCLAIAAVSTVDSVDVDPYESQPKITIRNGHISFKSGRNGNISFASTGQGTIQINGVDVGLLTKNINSGQSGSISENVQGPVLDYRSRIVRLEDRSTGFEDNLTAIDQKVTRFIGRGQKRLSNRALRQLLSKVKQLDDKYNTLLQLCSTDECQTNPCKNGGTCIDGFSSYKCICPDNWEGATCEEDVNECARFAGTSLGCQNGATCVNTPGAYRCDCAANWNGIHCTLQFDDCSNASHQELCGNGICINNKRTSGGQPSYHCICNPGWQKASNSPACTEDIDECSGPNRKCSQSPLVACINLPGTFHCGFCPAGYTGNGMVCSDINECEVNNGGCSQQPFVQCTNTIGSRSCGPCPTGYVGNGVQCSYIGVCSISRGGCHPLATCTENMAVTGTYRVCTCPSGYIGNGEGLTGCVQSTSPMSCATNPCQHGTCQMVGQAIHCQCESGYFGTLCEHQEIDPCSSSPCLNGGTCTRVRLSNQNSFNCNCTRGYTGQTCERGRTCSSVTFQTRGTWTIPENDQPYPGPFCSKRISGPPHKVYQLNFTEFNLGLDCTHQYFRIKNFFSQNTGNKYCNQDLQNRVINSTAHQVELLFFSSNFLPGTRLTVTWTTVDPICGGTLNVSDYGALSSPNYPGKYNRNVTCEWEVKVPYGKRIQFHFATLKLEQHENCSFDYVKILDGASRTDPVIGQYCTTTNPAPVTTSGHSAIIIFHSDFEKEDSGFHITYASQPSIQGCGGILTNGTGVFSSPNFPDVYQNNLVCEWLIRDHPDNRIQLNFKTFHLEGAANCLFDSLEVYDGEDDTAPLLGKYCGAVVPSDLHTSSHKLFVRFRSDSSVGTNGFKIGYRSICGGLFTEPNGTLQSPSYPDNYPSKAKCIFNIQAPPGNLIKLSFQSLEIEEDSNCKFDYIQVRDGDSEDSPSIAKLCGTAVPEPIVSTYNFLYMTFDTDGDTENKGFFAHYEFIDNGCGGVLTSSEGSLASPRHPDRYPHSITCSWYLKAPPGFIVQLTFLTFFLEVDGECRFDYVLVEEQPGEAKIGKYCGTDKPPVVTSFDNSLFVKFVADSSVARDGFTATYKFLNAQESCTITYHQESGVIRSPGYPERYPHNAQCVWVIQAPTSRQISLNVSSFTMEEAQNCNYDYLEIRNGGYLTSPLIGRYCSHQSIPTIRSHSNSLRLEFVTDSSMSAPGFEIYYDSLATGCGGKLTAPRGTIVSPNYPQAYPMNADCEWLIQVSAGSVISVVLVDIDVEEHAVCSYDYVQVFDGDSENSKSLIKICNNQQNQGPITSTGSSVLIRFRSDAVRAAGGFQLAYQTICNNKLTKRRGVIESPNFPNSYPHNHNCSWKIEAPKGNNISMSFSHLHLESSDSCDIDYVELIEVNSHGEWIDLGKFCGNTSKPPGNHYETSSNVAIVRLVTDRSVAREGFRLEYAMKGCGGEIVNKPYGVITSPNYPNGYPHTTECFWKISLPPDSRVELTINDLDIEPTPSCMYDYLRVWGGEDESTVRLLNVCSQGNGSQTVSSNGNHMFIHFYSDYTISHRGFQATFKRIDKGCGGTFSALEGFITTPNFPKPYTVSDDCEWLIKVDEMHTVILEFYEFNLPESEAGSCVNGYVSLHDGSDSSSPLLGKYCGPQKPENETVASGNVMLVKLVTNGINNGGGFKAHYKRGCGHRFLVSDEGGVITSPDYPDIFHSYSNCSWILYTNQPEKISLVITHMHLSDRNNCSYSSLVLSDGDLPDSPVIDQYCGTRSPPAIISRGSTLHVVLVKGGVFRAVFGIASTHCGGDFTSVRGTFTSPGYPYNYPEETECVWTIAASKGNKVQLSFESFILEDSSYCNNDYVEIHENSATGRLLGRFCGHLPPSNLTSAEKLWIKFRSNDISTDRGFLAHYEVEHGGILNASNGEIMSPGYPHRFHEQGDYTWTIFVPSGMSISVTFVKIDIATGSATTTCLTSVQLFDGSDEQAPELGRFCGFQVPEPVISTGNVVFVKYFASVYFSGSFHLRWNSVTPSGISIDIPVSGSGDTCAEEIQVNSTSEVLVTSPNYPQNYPDNYNCSYYLRTSSFYEHINLNITDMILERPTENVCRFDALQVYYLNDANVDDWTLNGTLCDRQSNVLFSSPTNLMKMVFTSDTIWNAQGFRAVAKSSCGAHLKQSNGVIKGEYFSREITSLFNSQQYGKIFECEYFMTVKPRRTIKIEMIGTFNFPSDSVCSTNYLKLGNGESSKSPPLGNGKFCGSSIPESFETDSNHAYVKIVVSSITGGTPTFTLKFSEVSQVCGGTYFVTDRVPFYEIKSPNYPRPPNHDLECEWTIISPSNTRMRLDFLSDIHLSPNCYGSENVEYLELIDGASMLSPPLKRFCGKDQPSSVMTTGNALLVHYVTAVENPQPGFFANISISDCGGTIVSFAEYIKSPNYPNTYSSNLNCEWNLQMKEGYHLVLIVSDLSTPRPSFGQNCSSTDFLEIRFPDAEGTILATLCGNISNYLINVPGPQAYMTFKSNSNSARNGKGFSLYMHGEFDDGCGGHLSASTGVITSPKYPNAVQGFRQCQWYIVAPEGRSVTLVFDEFNLAKDEAADLCLSYIIVSNVTQWVIPGVQPRKICGDSLPAPIESSSTSILMTYTSPGVTAGQGFSLHYTTDQESFCGGVLPLPSGEVTTPNFTLDEFSAMDCKWRVDGDLENQTLIFRFDVIDLPGVMAKYCRRGGMYIYADEVFLGRFCGNHSSEVIVTSPFSSTKIRIVTALNVPARLLHGTYNVSNCGGVFHGDNVVIYSPQYPQGYPPNTDCHWVVTAPPSGVLSLHIEELELEEDCTKDYVIIRNGFHLNSPVLAKLCGKKIPHPFTSSRGALSVIFHSDAYGSAKGFKIVTNGIQSGCGGDIHMRSGNFSSPNFPSHYTENAECIWTLDYVPGYLVQLDFIDRFDIQRTSSCQNDYLKIEEYIGGEWVDKGKQCGQQVPDTFKSKSNKVKVTFVSDGSVSGDGFNIKYSAVCGGNFTEPKGYIVSPNYPNFYDSSLNCTYTIGSSNQYVHLSFEEDFSIEGNNECYYDHITISHTTQSYDSNASPQQGPYCGDEAPVPRTLQGPVTMRFISDSSYSAHGFKANYEIFDCGGTLLSSSGEIRSPSSAMQFLGPIDCIWTIVAPSNKVVKLRITSINIKLSHSCWESYLEVRDGLENGRRILRMCSNQTGQSTIKSTGNTLTVRYFQSDPQEGRGVTAVYYSDYGPDQGCGGTITGSSGDIQSPHALVDNSDGLYYPNLDCSWFIVAGASDKILNISFERFDLESSSNNTCIFDYLELRDEFASSDVIGNGELIEKYCGSTVPDPIIVSTPKVHVLFHTDNMVQKTGFKLHYESIPSPCGPAALEAKLESQVLTSPGYPNPYKPNMNCRWFFYTNQTQSRRIRKMVQLTIHDMDISCQGDYLEVTRSLGQHFFGPIYGGLPSTNPLRLCSNNPVHQLFSPDDGNLIFHSGPGNTVSKGFSITYQEASCNQTYSKDSGFITNPGHPGFFNLEKYCLVTITVSEGKTIAVYFNDMQFPGEYGHCSNNAIDVYDGANITDPHLGQYCGYWRPQPIFSTGNSLHFRIQMLNGMGFYSFIYMASDKGRGCGGSIFADFGSITSPLYPRPYNKSDECIWHIAVPGYHTVSLEFSEFNLNSSAFCNSNYVELYDGDSPELPKRVARYCGSDNPGTHSSSSSHMLVKFVSDTTNNGVGFWLNFRVNPYAPDQSTFMQLNPTSPL